MNERLTWQEIVERYPDKWVFLIDYELNSAKQIVSGVVYVACTECDISSFEKELSNKGIDFLERRTTEPIGGICYVTI